MNSHNDAPKTDSWQRKRKPRTWRSFPVVDESSITNHHYRYRCHHRRRRRLLPMASKGSRIISRVVEQKVGAIFFIFLSSMTRLSV